MPRFHQRSTGEWDLLTWQDLTAEPTITALQCGDDDLSAFDIAPDGGIMAMVTSFPMIDDADGDIGANAPQTGTLSNASSQAMFGNNNSETTVHWFAADGSIVASATLSGMLMYTEALSGHRIAAYGYQSGVIIYDENGEELFTLNENEAQGLVAAGQGAGMAAIDGQ